MRNQLKYFSIVSVVVLSMISVSIMAQTTESDTVFVKKSMEENQYEIDTILMAGGINTPQVLVGTTFLPYSDKIIKLLNQGFSPMNLSIIKECNYAYRSAEFTGIPRVEKFEKNNDTLSIDVTIEANCCHNFLGEAEVINDNTLNLVYTAYGGFCSCNCLFTLRYQFHVWEEEAFQSLEKIALNGEDKLSGGQIDKN